MYATVVSGFRNRQRRAEAMNYDKCRYCARSLRVIPLDPTQIEPHCQSKGCRWCAECHAGQTPVSPVRPA